MSWHTVHIPTIDLTAFCFLRSWFAYLKERGHRVTLICGVDQFRDPLQTEVDELIDIKIPRRIEPFQDLRALLQLNRTLARLKPDIVHTHTTKAGILGRLASRWTALGRSWKGERQVTLHTIHELPHNSTQNRWLKLLYAGAEKLASPLADHYVTVSEVNRQQILGEGFCRPEYLTVIPNGLHLEKYTVTQDAAALRAQWGIPLDGIVLGTSARLELAKGHIYMLEALAQLVRADERIFWVCTGRGPLLEKLQSRAQELGLISHIRWLGWVEDLPSAMAAFDIFVLPSLYEGQGVVLLEAMAMKRPVVCCRVGGTADVVLHNETGLFVQARQSDELADAVLHLIQNESLRAQMGLAGWERVRGHFLAGRSDQTMYELYDRLLVGRRDRTTIL